MPQFLEIPGKQLQNYYALIITSSHQVLYKTVVHIEPLESRDPDMPEIPKPNQTPPLEDHTTQAFGKTDTMHS